MKTATEATQNKVAELVRKAESDYISGQTQISKYVSVSFYDDLNQIDAYLNSKHISGDKDSLDRDKPFFNICIAARNIWFRATDIDRKNIRVKATKSKDVIKSFLATVHLQNFMTKANFGQFLNDWGLGLANYGSYVSKFIEKDGELYAMAIPWNRLIVDSVDFENNPVIEIIELTPAQLRQRKGYDKDLVEKLIKTAVSRETISKEKKDNKSDYIKLYEVHGELPLSYLTGDEEDKDEYVQQMHVISYVASKEKGKWDDFTLVSGREKQSPYIITHLLKSDGYVLGMGAVKSLFEAQWMVNHSIKEIKDQLDLASKLILQTADSNYANRNVLSSIETGDILVYKEDMPITEVANTSHDITSLQAFGQQWQALAQSISSTPDIMRGENMPSGTAFRQALVVQQESHSNFEIMVENKGLAIEEMMRRFIIPFLKKKMDTAEEVSATLDAYGIDKIDEMYIRNESTRRAKQRIVQRVIEGQYPTPDEALMIKGSEEANILSELKDMGEHRFYSPSEINWKEEMKDLEWEIEVEITNENVDKQAKLDTLSTVLQTIAANPMILQDPNAKFVFNKILETAGGISPLEIQGKTTQQPAMPLQATQMVGGNNQPMPQQNVSV